MLIRGSRGLTRIQILLAGALGTLGGVYIWKPIFQKHWETEQTQLEQNKAELESKDDSHPPISEVLKLLNQKL